MGNYHIIVFKLSPSLTLLPKTKFFCDHISLDKIKISQNQLQLSTYNENLTTILYNSI